jgi:N-acetylglucosaminyldiphosphoundecaprenol N-acetyl-beta-D-mannosaminyltransferase
VRARSEQRERLAIGGVLIDRVDLASAIDRIEGFVRSRAPHQVVTVNLDFLSIAARNPHFRAVINNADLAVPDGMPLVWLGRLKGQPLTERVAGVELVGASCELAATMGSGVFLLGAAPGIAEAAARKLEVLHPGVRIVGTYTPPMGPIHPDEDEHMVQAVRDASPDFLFVALGAPRQDLWVYEHQPQLQVPVAMGVGCVLDLLAGASQRAPYWMRSTGLEWLFRLAREPRRLWRRYLLDDLPIFAQLLWELPKGEVAEAQAS